jgi:hypothetical protein
MAKETFVVGCEGIGFHGGVLLVDMAGLSESQKDAEGRPLREHKLRLLMTPEGMLETVNAMQGMIARLVEVGLLKRTEGPAQEAPQVQSSGGEGQPKSPNF